MACQCSILMMALAVVVSTAPTAGAAGRRAVTAQPGVKRTHSTAGVHATLLFVTSGASGTLAPVPGSSSTYSLTLQGLDRNVVWFTDHPARKAGTVPASGFVQDWSGYGFAADPPNAALVLDAAHPGQDTAVGSLSSPSFDPGTDTLRADFTLFTGQRLKQVTGDLADKARRATGATLPASFGGASLFIDDAWEPGGGEQTINAVRFPQQGTTYTGETLVGTGPMTFSSTGGSPLLLAFGSVQGNFAGSTFVGDVSFTTPSMSGVNLSDVTQSGTGIVEFNVIDFSDADLQGANLPNTYFLSGVDLDGADLQGATLGPAPGAITNADTTCTNGAPGPCTGPGLTSG